MATWRLVLKHLIKRAAAILIKRNGKTKIGDFNDAVQTGQGSSVLAIYPYFDINVSSLFRENFCDLVLAPPLESKIHVFDSVLWILKRNLGFSFIGKRFGFQMMLSKVEPGKKMGEDSGNEKLSNEIETISKALYVDSNLSRSPMYALGNRPKSAGKTQWLDAKSKIKHGSADPSHKDKKSFWNWKPFKGLSHSRNRKFNCCFSLQVHSIEGLPSTFDNRSVCVHLKSREGNLVTRPVKVLDRVAEFDEMLVNSCMVSGTRSGTHHSTKYEPKHFLLYASLFDAPKQNLGKHRVDVTRLLPITLEELEEDKSSGAWSTSYKLSGQAKGATMNVSFGYAVVGDSPEFSGLNMSKFQGDAKGETNHSDSFYDTPNLQSHASSRSVDNMKDLHELLPTRSSELAIFVDVLRQKFDEDKRAAAVDHKPELDEFLDHLEPIKSCSNSMSESSHKGIENEFMEHLEPIKPHSCSMSESSHKGTENEFTEHYEPITSHSCSMSESSHKGVENEFMEHLDPVKSHCCLISKSSHNGIGNGFMEQLEPIKSHSCKMSESSPQGNEKECENGRFSVTDQGMESSNQELERLEDAAAEPEAVTGSDVAPENGTMLSSSLGANVAPCDGNFEEEFICSKESILKDLDHALSDLSNLEIEALDSPDEKEDCMVVKTDNEVRRVERSSSLDELTESVANEFLDMLGIEHSPCSSSPKSEPESPRERLLRQFEKDVLSGGFPLFDFNFDYGYQNVSCGASTASRLGDSSEDFELPSVIPATERQRQMETRSIGTRTGAKTLEDMETEALMRQWGLNDKAFQFSPRKSSCGFGSPIDMPPEKPLELPPLAEGLGPILQTRNGGFLRSMNPSLFKNAKNGGDLIMQVSSLVVVPAEMGSDIMEILQQLASLGIEKLSMQANKLMPLEDITGKTMQRVAWEAAIVLEAPERQSLSQEVLEIEVKQRLSGSRYDDSNSSSIGSENGSEYVVSLEDLAPLAMDKIEALSIEGLRIQSGMSDEDAPSNIRARSIGGISAIQGKAVSISGSFGLEATAGLKLLNIKDNGDDIDGLMGLSLTLDEWLRLDSGEFGDGDEISDRTCKILAAHHASSLDLIRGGSKVGRKRGEGSGRKCGLLGNNFTVALMVQLRDPIRNYEPVGTPMLALIQVERVFIPPKPKIYYKVPEVTSNNEEDDESKSVVKEEVKEAGQEKALEDKKVAQFRISEVYVAGLNLKTEPGKKQLWGNSTQQQSGSRWLLANGMGKGNTHQIMKSKTCTKSPAPLPTKAWAGDALWSTSSRVHFRGDKCMEPTRNPNVIFPRGSIWLR